AARDPPVGVGRPRLLAAVVSTARRLVSGCRFEEDADARPLDRSDRQRHPGARSSGAARPAVPRRGAGDRHLRCLRQAGEERQGHSGDPERPRLLRLQPGVPRENQKEEETVAATLARFKNLAPDRNQVCGNETRLLLLLLLVLLLVLLLRLLLVLVSAPPPSSRASRLPIIR